MIPIIVTCDEQDSELGSYFAHSKQYLADFLAEMEHTLEHVEAQRCNQPYIDMLLERTQKPLVFISYTHGETHSLRCNGVAYLATDNIEPLHTSFVYAMSCLAATELGATFKKQDGVFIGFDKEVQAFKSGEYLNTCILCDNFGIIYAISNPNSTIKEAYKVMKQYYTTVIDKLDDMKEQGTYIGYFRNMRDSLKIIGNENLTVNKLREAIS
jgi:hypothetical protein